MVIFGVGSWIRDSSKKEAARLKRDTCQHYGRRSGSCKEYGVICCSTCKNWEQKRDRPRRKSKEKSYIKRLSEKLLGDEENMEKIIETIRGIDRFQWILQHCKIGEKIIDIGSQDGHTFNGTPFVGYVTSVDLDKYDFPGFVQMDACDLKFSDKKFDIAILGEILEHVADSVKVLKEANRVAKRVLITVPNEYEWDKSLFPFQTIEEDSKRTNRTIEQMAKDGNPEAIEFNTEDGLRHLWHCRYYIEDTLRKDLANAEIVDYRMEKLNYGGWSFFVVDTKIDVNEVGTSIDTARVGDPNITYGTDVNVAKRFSNMDNSKLRIALISTPFFTIPPKGYSGLEMVLWDLAEGLDELGHIVTIFANEGSKTPKHGMLVTTGPDISTVNVNWYKEEENRYFKWKDIVTNDRYDVVCGHDWFGFEYFHKMNNLKLKVAHVHHGGYIWDTAPPFPKPNLIAISKFMRDYTINYFRQKGFNVDCQFVWNGINLDRYSFDPLVKKTNRLLYVGRFSRFKQPDMTIRIAKATGFPIDLVGGTFVDDSDYMSQIESMCNGKDIRMLKDVSHETKIELMQKAKAVIIPSKMNEPLNLVSIEAQACGTPVIVTRDGGLPETVNHGITGFICDTEQEIEEAIGKIDTIKSSDCRKWVEENFSRQRMAREYEKLFYQIVKGEDW
jgi:glycosyltransferase involved in cell wall biosynthesis/SAM-dependent methyltransferase